MPDQSNNSTSTVHYHLTFNSASNAQNAVDAINQSWHPEWVEARLSETDQRECTVIARQGIWTQDEHPVQTFTEGFGLTNIREETSLSI